MRSYLPRIAHIPIVYQTNESFEAGATVPQPIRVTKLSHILFPRANSCHKILEPRVIEGNANAPSGRSRTTGRTADGPDGRVNVCVVRELRLLNRHLNKNLVHKHRTIHASGDHTAVYTFFLSPKVFAQNNPALKCTLNYYYYR